MILEDYELPDIDGRRIAFLIDTNQTERVKRHLLSLGPKFETEDAIFLSGFGLAVSPGPITAAFANTKKFSCNILRNLKLAAEAIPGSFTVVVIGDVDERRLARTVRLLEDAEVSGREIDVVCLAID